MLRPILNLADLTFEPMQSEIAPTGPAAERFEATTAAIGSRIGARDLGYNVTAVPPGKRAWPFHNHPAKEEMFLVLHGRGEVRIGSDRYPICTGDVIACPAGGAETAHQIINTGIEELRYLAVSIESNLEMAQYPDSGKFAVKAEFGGGRRVIVIGRDRDHVDFWEGE